MCFVMKAARLEILHNLTTSAFLAALKRFLIKRGKSSEQFSDKGRNLAINEINNTLKSLNPFNHTINK